MSGCVLALDQGNTRAKATLVCAGPGSQTGCGLPKFCFEGRFTVAALAPIIKEYGVTGAVYCSVGHPDEDFLGRLDAVLQGRLLVFGHGTPLPVGIEYRTPSTLGLDRIAAAVGCVRLFGDSACVVVDAGTALTIDVVTGGIFRGGNISPGVRMRLRSLHEFTARLPLVDPDGELPPWGDDTATALRCGCVRGAVAEIDSVRGQLAACSAAPRVVLTGGDACLLHKALGLRADCTVVPDLVAVGLGAIYNYNMKRP